VSLVIDDPINVNCN